MYNRRDQIQMIDDVLAEVDAEEERQKRRNEERDRRLYAPILRHAERQRADTERYFKDLFDQVDRDQEARRRKIARENQRNQMILRNMLDANDRHTLGKYLSVDQEDLLGFKQMGTVTLYHGTSEDSAKAIARSRKMLRGKVGYNGGGIYFGKSKRDCLKKMLHGRSNPYFVTAKVNMGKALIVRSGAEKFTYRGLKRRGFDSVYAERNTGPEYIVYNWSQVEIVTIVEENTGRVIFPSEDGKSASVPTRAVQSDVSCDESCDCVLV